MGRPVEKMTPAYELNGKPINAQAFYKVACDPRRHVAVEACAGAGKTWMLVSRIVRALLDGALPHEILAITFTKRAAGEMRERLHQWLAEFAVADDATLARELSMRGIDHAGDATSMALREALRYLYANLLATGRQVQIRTFHSWFAALLRNAPFSVLQQLALPPNYELLEDDTQAKSQVWRRFYTALMAQPALRADFEAVVFEHGRFQAERALMAALGKRLEFGLADAQGVVDGSVKHFAQQFPQFAGLQLPQEILTRSPANFQLFQQAASALGRASAPTFSAKGVELEQALAQLASADGMGNVQGNVQGKALGNRLEGVLLALLTQAGTQRKFGEKIVGIAVVREAQALALEIQATLQQHAAWVYQQHMARLSRLLIAEFAELKRERGWVDMNDVERAASVMLSDEVLSGWLQQRLDARIRHVLIDEFQDTSPLQWQALFSWLSAYAGAGGGSSGGGSTGGGAGSGGGAPSVFIVGDPKQSIYRFRRAEPQVFKAAKTFVKMGLLGDVLSCDHTRRNAPEVMDAVNTVMNQAMSGVIEGDVYDGFRTHTTESSIAGYVGCLPPICRNAGGADAPQDPEMVWRDSLTEPQTEPEETLRTQEAHQAALWIAQRIANSSVKGVEAGMAPKDIMVLSRKRAGLAPLHEALRALQIASQIGEKTELIDCAEVQDIVALFDVLVSTQHDLSFARVLKSPLFGLEDAALVEIALLHQKQGGSWFELLQKKELLRPALHDLGSVLLKWKRWVDELPPHDALQAIYSQGDVLARFAAAAPAPRRAAVMANLRALPGMALELGGGRFATPYAFVRALKAGGVQATAAVVDNAVRLLTIHGAKGLEADVVLMLDSDVQPPRAESMGVLMQWPGEAAHPLRFVFLASESQPPACCIELLAQDQQERQREELNALYVALTRAKTRLVLSSIEPHRAAAGSWWARLKPLARPLDHEVAQSLALMVSAQNTRSDPDTNTEEATVTILELPPRLANGSVDASFDAPENVAEKTDAEADEAAHSVRGGLLNEAQGEPSAPPESDSSRVGQAMHRLLEWGQGATPRATAGQLAAVAREFDLSALQAQQAADMAQRIRQGAGAWTFDASVLAWAGNEVDLMFEGQTLRLDRLVQRRDTGAWWVLDYKSSAAPLADPTLVTQLARYRAAIQVLYPQAQVVAAFLTGDGEMVLLPGVE